MKFKFKTITISLIFIFFSSLSLANFTKDIIEWTVPPEGGYGKFIWRQNGEVFTIKGEYSHNKVYWWEAEFKYGEIIFRGEVKGVAETNTWLPIKGYLVSPDFKGLKFYINNERNLNCTNWDCQFFTEVSNSKDTIEINIIGLNNASKEFYLKLSKLELEREKLKKEKEDKKIAEEKKIQEEQKENELPEANELVEAGSGSGFYISDKGVVVTNYHVIEGCEKVMSSEIELDLISFDIYNDLALLNSNLKKTSYLKIRDNKILQGEDIYVVGYPFGKDLSTSAKITKGIVTSLHGIANDYAKMQIDAPIQKGNSGGPVLDSKGELVGIAVAKADAEYFIENYGAIPDDINFAVKTDILLSMMSAHNITQENKKVMEVSSGADVFKIANPSTLYLTCYMKYGDLIKLSENE